MTDISTILIEMGWAMRAASESICNPSQTDEKALRIALLKIRELAGEGLDWMPKPEGPMPDRFGKIL